MNTNMILSESNNPGERDREDNNKPKKATKVYIRPDSTTRISHDRFSDQFGAVYEGPDLGLRYYDALARLGPLCPVCGYLASAFEIVHSADGDFFNGLVECKDKMGCGGKTHRLVLNENTKTWQLRSSQNGIFPSKLGG